LVLVLAGCDLTEPCPNGSCHVFADSSGNGSYDFCGESSCNVGKVSYPVPKNTNVKCNCK
jgi:hypothetical protein